MDDACERIGSTVRVNSLADRNYPTDHFLHIHSIEISVFFLFGIAIAIAMAIFHRNRADSETTYCIQSNRSII